jgi:tryptophan 2,3-dioxygenase
VANSRTLESHDPTYQNYLEVRRLLKLQKTLSRPTHHDELIFIVTHQASELWFKVILHEMDEVYRLMVSGDVTEATRLLNRVLEIEALLIQQTRIIERMLPTDFMKFRDFLGKASGLQSIQFREIEFLSGLKDERFLLAQGYSSYDSEKLKRRFDGPSLWDGFRSVLAREGFDIDPGLDERKLSESERVSKALQREVTALTEVYSSGLHIGLVELAEALVTHDENFGLWRYLHMVIVERMIGQKPGTGQADVKEVTGHVLTGVEYLKSTQAKRFFPALWMARTSLTNR